MKKILFGLTLIAFDITLWLAIGIGKMEFNTVFQIITLILPIIGLAVSAWGLFDKEDK